VKMEKMGEPFFLHEFMGFLLKSPMVKERLHKVQSSICCLFCPFLPIFSRGRFIFARVPTERPDRPTWGLSKLKTIVMGRLSQAVEASRSRSEAAFHNTLFPLSSVPGWDRIRPG